jgi:hypothetical protein
MGQVLLRAPPLALWDFIYPVVALYLPPPSPWLILGDFLMLPVQLPLLLFAMVLCQVLMCVWPPLLTNLPALPPAMVAPLCLRD